MEKEKTVVTSKKSRLQSMLHLVDSVHKLLKHAAAHGRILVGPIDESGIGDDVYPAWARRNVAVEKVAEDNKVYTIEAEINNNSTTLEDEVDNDSLSDESSILSFAPPQVSRYDQLEIECKKLLNHNAKITEAELILYPPPPTTVTTVEGDDDEEEEVFEPLLPLVSRNEILVTIVQQSNTIVPFYHSKCGISDKRRSRSMAWGEQIHEMGMVGHPGGPLNKPERFSMFDGTFVNPLDQTIAPYITLLPELTYDPYEAEMERRKIYQEKQRILKLIHEEEERERLAEMKEFLRKRRAAKETLSLIWKKPSWIKDFRGDANNGNGYDKEFNILTRKKHASDYVLTQSPFHAIGPKKMKKIVEKCNALDINKPRKFIKKMYAKYFIQDDRIGPPNTIPKYTAPGAVEMDLFIRDLGLDKDFTFAYKLFGVHVDHRGGILPFDTFMNNIITFSLLSPIQLVAYVFYILPNLEEPSEGYLLRNMHLVINMLHGTKKYPVVFPKNGDDDVSDLDDEDNMFLDESILFSKVRENNDKMDLAVDILNKLPANATHVELFEALFDYPILLWPAFAFQDKVRRKLRGELYWKTKNIDDDNLKLLQKQVYEENIKKRKLDKKEYLLREKKRKKMLKNKKNKAERKLESQIVVKQKVEEKITEEIDKSNTKVIEEKKMETIQVKETEEQETIYEEVENVHPKLLALSKYIYFAKHQEMSEKHSWGLTARTLLVNGASRRHVGALISRGLLSTIFGRSRTKEGKILLIQIWWKLLYKKRKLKSKVDNIHMLIKNHKVSIKEKEIQLSSGTKSKSKLEKEIVNLRKNIKKFETDVKNILESDSFTKTMKEQIQEREAVISKRVGKSAGMGESLKERNQATKDGNDCEDNDKFNEYSDDNLVKKPDKVITADISNQFREGYCITPHCNTLINLVDMEESIGFCSTCRTYSINYWAMKKGYKWGYRMIRRIEDTIVHQEPDHLECNSWMLFRDTLVRSNFYFNIDTGHSRWELAPWHKKNRKSFTLTKDEPVLVWEKERREKIKFRNEVLAAQRAKAEAMRKKDRRKPAYQTKKKK